MLASSSKEFKRVSLGASSSTEAAIDAVRQEAEAEAAAVEAAADTKNNNTSNTIMSADNGLLPLGWIAHTDPDGRTYYHNQNTGKSVWGRPTEAAAPGSQLLV